MFNICSIYIIYVYIYSCVYVLTYRWRCEQLYGHLQMCQCQRISRLLFILQLPSVVARFCTNRWLTRQRVVATKKGASHFQCPTMERCAYCGAIGSKFARQLYLQVYCVTYTPHRTLPSVMTNRTQVSRCWVATT